MAYKKKCPECGEYCYSTNRKNLSECATCSTDISDIKAIPAGKEVKEE